MDFVHQFGTESEPLPFGVPQMAEVQVQPAHLHGVSQESENRVVTWTKLALKNMYLRCPLRGQSVQPFIGWGSLPCSPLDPGSNPPIEHESQLQTG